MFYYRTKQVVEKVVRGTRLWPEALKSLLPRTLFWRALLIVVTPLLLVQILGTLIFYDRHVEAITRRLVLSVGGEVNMVMVELDRMPNAAAAEEFVLRTMRTMGLIVGYLPNQKLEDISVARPSASLIRRKMEATFAESLQQPFLVDIDSDPDWVQLYVKYGDGVLHVQFWHKRIRTSTTYVFVLWSWGLSLILVAISIIFLRNQIRPIKQLAKVADAFGRGVDVGDSFKPSGAREVRQAGTSFMEMRDRIQRHISQRTEMLAGVSHDLRTPLTRMKLQVAMLPEDPGLKTLESDMAEMETMINGYLEFARGQVSEPTQVVDLIVLLRDVIDSAARSGLSVTFDTEYTHVQAVLRPNGIRRALTNILENARRYADHARVTINLSRTFCDVIIEDDGPGIPEDKRTEVFRPFRRLESSRNTETGGAGLGLSIVRDVVQGIGGEVRLDQSDMGGLKVTLALPR